MVMLVLYNPVDQAVTPKSGAGCTALQVALGYGSRGNGHPLQVTEDLSRV
jgi:hypothetical protein